MWQSGFLHINVSLRVDLFSYEFDFGRFDFEFGKTTTFSSLCRTDCRVLVVACRISGALFLFSEALVPGGFNESRQQKYGSLGFPQNAPCSLWRSGLDSNTGYYEI